MQTTADDETIRRFQIGNLQGEKWKSTCVSPHAEISITDQQATPEFWFLEKHDTEPLWSFYAPLSDNLHVECDEAARGATSLTEELKNRANKLFENLKAATDKLKLEMQQKTSQDPEESQQQQSTDKLQGNNDGTPAVSEAGLTSDVVKKYYVTYNKKSDGDSNVTLELSNDDDSSLIRYFYAFYQPSGRLRLQPKTTPGKFLGVKNGALTVLDEKDIKEEHEWVIDVEVMAGSKQKKIKARVTIYGHSLGLISKDAENGDHIRVGTGNDFDWIIKHDHDTGTITFQVPDQGLYAFACILGLGTFGSSPSKFVLDYSAHVGAFTVHLLNSNPKLYFITGGEMPNGQYDLLIRNAKKSALGLVFTVEKFYWS